MNTSDKHEQVVGRIDVVAAAAGYRRIGGTTNRVYLHTQRGEILKVAIETDARSSRRKHADFQLVRRVSAEYAAQG